MAVVDEVFFGDVFVDSEDSSLVDIHVPVYSILCELATTVAGVRIHFQPLALSTIISGGVFDSLVVEFVCRLPLFVNQIQIDVVLIVLLHLVFTPDAVSQEVIIVVFDRPPGVVKSEGGVIAGFIVGFFSSVFG